MAKTFEELSKAGRRYRVLREAAISGGYEPARRVSKYASEEERKEARSEYAKKYRTSDKGKAAARLRRQKVSRGYAAAKKAGLI